MSCPNTHLHFEPAALYILDYQDSGVTPSKKPQYPSMDLSGDSISSARKNNRFPNEQKQN